MSNLTLKITAAAFCIATVVKILLINTYKSTDFEVHRNWLAITHVLPLKEWYFESTSQWTLDYPPGFAYFEWVLGRFALFFDEGMVTTLSTDPYDTHATVLFQRFTVMVTDGILALGALQAARALGKTPTGSGLCASLIILSPGLFFVDHIHFQYNGFLLGILLLSIASLAKEQYVLGGLLYAILLTLKHLYLPLAPVYFVFLLKKFVIGPGKSPKSQMLARFVLLGGVVLTIFAAAFMPFLLQPDPVEQVAQILKRLFPFGRGLCHAYWAPNIWALYMFVDRLALLLLKRFNLATSDQMIASSTGGLVHDLPPAVLPRISPLLCMALVILSIVPALVILWQKPKPRIFVWSVVYASLMAFMFGYHVHEKAILTALIPLALLAIDSKQTQSLFLQFSKMGVFSIHPLLPKTETLNKVVLYLSYTLCAEWGISAICDKDRPKYKDKSKVSEKLGNFKQIDSIITSPIVDRATTLCCSLLFIFTELIHPLIFRQKDGSISMEFLPYMATSVYCGVFFVLGSWSVLQAMLLEL